MRGPVKSFTFALWICFFTFVQGEEITCTPPGIPNGNIIQPAKEYKQDDILKYACNRGYRRSQGTPKCTKYGWSLNPECDELYCLLEQTSYGIKRIIPEGKRIFKIGESVEIICSETYLIFRTRENKKSITCLDTGDWDTKPTCEEIRCEVPYTQHVYVPRYSFYGDLKLGVTKSYRCQSGYRGSGRATCTQNGWTPDPLCAEIICETPKIPNAQIVGNQEKKYKINSIIQYKCLHGFKPEQPQQITCNSQGRWSDIQPCIDGTCQGEELNNVKVLFGYPGISPPYHSGHILVFQCTDDNMKMFGKRAIECQSDGRWDNPYPTCDGKIQCSKPAKHLRFVTLLDSKTVYNNSEILRYKCNFPYNETRGGELMCQNGKWNGTFDCTSRICPPPPYIEDGDYTEKKKDGEIITEVDYKCQLYYVLDKQQEHYKCQNGRWETPPKCLRPCEINKSVERYNLQPPQQTVYVKHGDNYRLTCKPGWNTGGVFRSERVDVSCTDGKLDFNRSCEKLSLRTT